MNIKVERTHHVMLKRYNIVDNQNNSLINANCLKPDVGKLMLKTVFTGILLVRLCFIVNSSLYI